MNPTAELAIRLPAADRDWLWLSESLTATLRIEGPTPLSVAVPKEWLRADAAAAWQITPQNNPKSESLPGGRSAWTIEFRIDPYVPGESVPLAFAPVAVVGDGVESQLELPTRTMLVKTRFANAQATDAIPIMSYEDPPLADSSNSVPIIAIGCGVVILAVLAWIGSLRFRRRIESKPQESTTSRLSTLRSDNPSITSRRFAEELAQIVRRHLESEWAIPANNRTTGELVGERLKQPRELLEWCDRIIFGAAEASLDERTTILNEANAWLTTQPHKHNQGRADGTTTGTTANSGNTGTLT